MECELGREFGSLRHHLSRHGVLLERHRKLLCRRMLLGGVVPREVAGGL